MRWLSTFSPFGTSVKDRHLIAEGMMMYETDHADKPITFRFSTDEGRAQYSLTRSEAVFLKAKLQEHLEKGSSQ